MNVPFWVEVLLGFCGDGGGGGSWDDMVKWFMMYYVLFLGRVCGGLCKDREIEGDG